MWLGLPFVFEDRSQPTLFLDVALFVEVSPYEIHNPENKAEIIPQEICGLFAFSACHNNGSFLFLSVAGMNPAWCYADAIM